MKTPPLKTRTQIEEFAFILISTGVKIPPNVTLMVKLRQHEFEAIAPRELVINQEALNYHSRAGIDFVLEAEH